MFFTLPSGFGWRVSALLRSGPVLWLAINWMWMLDAERFMKQPTVQRTGNTVNQKATLVRYKRDVDRNQAGAVVECWRDGRDVPLYVLIDPLRAILGFSQRPQLPSYKLASHDDNALPLSGPSHASCTSHESRTRSAAHCAFHWTMLRDYLMPWSAGGRLTWSNQHHHVPYYHLRHRRYILTL